MTAIDELPPLRDVIARYGLDARKALGQNFLLDLNLTRKIALSGGSLEGLTIIEVGPGPGGLTRALLACGASQVIAIERDSRCIPALAEISAHYPERLHVIEGDALTSNYRELADGHNTRVIANLPYNIGTQLLVGWLLSEPWPPFCKHPGETAGVFELILGGAPLGSQFVCRRVSAGGRWPMRPDQSLEPPPSSRGVVRRAGSVACRQSGQAHRPARPVDRRC